MLAQRMALVMTSLRRETGSEESFQNLPSRSGIAATAWLPVVTVITLPRPRRRSQRLSTTSTLGRSARRAETPRSKTKVSSPRLYASNTRSRPIETVFTCPASLVPVDFTFLSSWRMAFICGDGGGALPRR